MPPKPPFLLRVRAKLAEPEFWAHCIDVLLAGAVGGASVLVGISLADGTKLHWIVVFIPCFIAGTFLRFGLLRVIGLVWPSLDLEAHRRRTKLRAMSDKEIWAESHRWLRVRDEHRPPPGGTRCPVCGTPPLIVCRKYRDALVQNHILVLELDVRQEAARLRTERHRVLGAVEALRSKRSALAAGVRK